MTYNPNIPQPGDLLSVSQNDIKTNFLSADNSFGTNHYKFSDLTANNGKHKFCEFVNLAAVPGGLSSGEGTLYTKPAATPGGDLYYTDDAGGVEYQITRVNDAAIATFGTSVNGWTFLPGGLIMKYGTFLTVPSSFTTYTPPGPAFTNVPTAIVLTVNSSSSTDNAAMWTNATTTTVDVRVFTGNRTVSYMIIGK